MNRYKFTPKDSQWFYYVELDELEIIVSRTYRNEPQWFPLGMINRLNCFKTRKEAVNFKNKIIKISKELNESL